MKHRERRRQGTLTISIPQKTEELAGVTKISQSWSCGRWTGAVSHRTAIVSARTAPHAVSPHPPLSSAPPTLPSLAKSDNNGIQDDRGGQPPRAEGCTEDGLEVQGSKAETGAKGKVVRGGIGGDTTERPTEIAE